MSQTTNYQDDESWAAQFKNDDSDNEERTTSNSPTQTAQSKKTAEKARLSRKAQLTAKQARDHRIRESQQIVELAASRRRATRRAECEERTREAAQKYAETWHLTSPSDSGS